MKRDQISSENLGIPSKAISWAGLCPWNNRICVGTEDGYVGFADIPILTKVVDNPVNGIAFLGDMLALTTTEEIVAIRRDPKNEFGFIDRSLVYDGGAYGVIDSPTGCFLAPLGKDGILAFRHESNGGLRVQIGTWNEPGRYYYKLIHLGESSGHEQVFACATRSSGLFVFSLESGALAAMAGDESDGSFNVMDVCSLRSTAWPHAVACLCSDRVLVLFGDALNSHPRKELSLERLDGKPYEVASLQGNLFILTDKCFYLLQNVAERFFNGDNFDSPVKLEGIPIAASDVFTIGEDRVALQVGEEVRVFGVADSLTKAVSPSKLFFRPSMRSSAGRVPMR